MKLRTLFFVTTAMQSSLVMTSHEAWVAASDEHEGLGVTFRSELIPILTRPHHLTTDVALPIIGVPIIDTEASVTGRGVYVGVVDSGFDVMHPALRDSATGNTRFEWLIDYTKRGRGKHAELEAQHGIPACLVRSTKDNTKASDDGECVVDAARCPSAFGPCAISRGAIYAKADLDGLLASPAPAEPIPTDEQGHGTHAMSVAAGSRENGTSYRGVAPDAHLVGVKADVLGDTVSPASILQGVRFIFDRAAAAKAPAVVNLSLTADFVVRDGSDAFAPAIAELARGPGRIIVAAAGNNGDPGAGSHQTATTSSEGGVRVTFSPQRGASRVLIIAAPRSSRDGDVRIGCDTPTGASWVSPIERGRTRSGQIGDLIANVIWNPADFHGLLPAGSTSALLTMEGAGLNPKERYGVVLEGSGTVDFWIFGGNFTNGVREQTIGSPANHPDIIAVGATVARLGYRSRSGEDFKLEAAVYDGPGGVLIPALSGEVTPGQVGAFSGAGPGPQGGIKPDLLAPGVVIVAAASRERAPQTSVFLGRSRCPRRVDGQTSTDDQCTLVDDQHGMATGTSFASPFVAGAAAILLEVDPTLRQDEVRVALQSGVHRHRSSPKFPESASVGELDVPGSVDVVRRMQNAKAVDAPPPATPASSNNKTKLVRPITSESWITASSHYVPADGTRPLEVLFHLRGERAEPADGFDINRFGSFLAISDGEGGGGPREPQRLERIAPGLWRATFEVPTDRAPSALTIHATFDRVDVAAPLTLPIALDPWQARYPSSARGPSCSANTQRKEGDRSIAFLLLALLFAVVKRREESAERAR